MPGFVKIGRVVLKKMLKCVKFTSRRTVEQTDRRTDGQPDDRRTKCNQNSSLE